MYESLEDLILQQIHEAMKQGECAVKVEYCDLCNSQKANRCSSTRDTLPDSKMKTKNQNFGPPSTGSLITPSQYIAQEWFQLQQKQIPVSTLRQQKLEIKKETQDSEDEEQQTEDATNYPQLVQKSSKNMDTQLAMLHKSFEASDMETPPSKSMKLIQSAVYRNKKLAKPPLETEPVVLCRRQKQIDYGKNTEGYRCYVEAVSKNERKVSDPKTPPLRRKYSRRHWDSIVRNWRMQLHKWDPPTLNALDLGISDELKKPPSVEQEQRKKESCFLEQEKKKLEEDCQKTKTNIRSVKLQEKDLTSKKQVFSFPNSVVLDQKEQRGYIKKHHFSADVLMPGCAGEPRSVALNLQNIPPGQLQSTATNNQIKSSLTIWQQLDKIGAPFAWQQNKAVFP